MFQTFFRVCVGIGGNREPEALADKKTARDALSIYNFKTIKVP